MNVVQHPWAKPLFEAEWQPRGKYRAMGAEERYKTVCEDYGEDHPFANQCLKKMLEERRKVWNLPIKIKPPPMEYMGSI